MAAWSLIIYHLPKMSKSKYRSGKGSFYLCTSISIREEHVFQNSTQQISSQVPLTRIGQNACALASREPQNSVFSLEEVVDDYCLGN